MLAIILYKRALCIKLYERVLRIMLYVLMESIKTQDFVWMQ